MVLATWLPPLPLTEYFGDPPAWPLDPLPPSVLPPVPKESKVGYYGDLVYIIILTCLLFIIILNSLTMDEQMDESTVRTFGYILLVSIGGSLVVAFIWAASKLLVSKVWYIRS